LYKKGKAVPLQACSGPEDSRKLRLPDFITMAQDGGKVVSCIVKVIWDLYLWKFYTEMDLCVVLLLICISL